MSEKIYAWLLRLFPARFPETYGDEALQLFRDRARDETGLFDQLRLWFDLLGDLDVSVPHEYGRAGRGLIAAATQRGVPSFYVLRNESPRTGALLFGSALSLIVIGALWTTLAKPVAIESAKIDSAERQRVIEAAIADLKRYYVYPEVAQKMADALRVHEKNGDDSAETNGAAFAEVLTKQMRDVSHDRHLRMVYRPDIIPDRESGPTPEDLTRYREDMVRTNCTFKRSETLPEILGT